MNFFSTAKTEFLHLEPRKNEFNLCFENFKPLFHCVCFITWSLFIGVFQHILCFKDKRINVEKFKLHCMIIGNFGLNRVGVQGREG